MPNQDTTSLGQGGESANAPTFMLDQLVSQAVTGSDAAFAALWRNFQPRMVRYLAMFTNEPEDLCSEVWIKIAASMKSFQGDSQAFKVWIYKIARNAATDLSRKKSRTPITSEINDADWKTNDSSMLEVMDLVRMLPSDYADVIMLRVVADLDISDVAQILGKTQANIRVQTHRGLKQLNEILMKVGEIK